MSNKRLCKQPEQPPGTYAALPHAVIDSPAYLGSTLTAKVILIALLRQHNGRNNGHFKATLGKMKQYASVRSNDTISRAIKELISRRLVVCTKLGGLNAGASKYAITWLPLTDCKGLDFTANGHPIGGWKLYKPTENDSRQKRDTSIPSRVRSERARQRRDASAAQNAPGKNTRCTPTDGADCTVGRCSTTPSDSTGDSGSVPSNGAKNAGFHPRVAPSDGDKCTVPGAPARAELPESCELVAEHAPARPRAKLKPKRANMTIALHGGHSTRKDA